MHCPAPGTPPALILSSSLSFLLPPYFLVPTKPAGFFLPPAFALHAAQCRTFPLSSIVSSVIFTYTNKNCSERVLRYRQRFFPADIRLYGQIIQQNYDIPACNLPITKTAKICLSNYFLHKFWKNLERCITLDRSTGKSLCNSCIF